MFRLLIVRKAYIQQKYTEHEGFQMNPVHIELNIRGIKKSILKVKFLEEITYTFLHNTTRIVILLERLAASARSTKIRGENNLRRGEAHSKCL